MNFYRESTRMVLGLGSNLGDASFDLLGQAMPHISH